MTAIRFSSLLVIAVLFLGCPLGPFSGGRLSGTEHSTPVADWSFVNDVESCQLETNPEDPHSINCWCYGSGSSVYVPSSMILGPTQPTEREWVRNVEANPAVRLRVGKQVYDLRAVRVSDDAEYAEVLRALEEKYEAAPEDREAGREIWLYRMEAR